MPLRGDLKEFGVPEIFQLLDQQGKTGCLHIKTSARDLDVYFREGMVVGAFPSGEKPSDHLLGILCRVGYLSEKDVRRVDKRRASDLTSLKEILRGEALLGPRQIDVLLREHIEELLFPVFGKRRGEFFFVQDKTLPSDWELGEPLAAEPLVLEGLRKSDEWPLLKKRLGSFHEIPQRQLVFRGKGRRSWKQRLKALWSRARGAGEAEAPDGQEDDFLVEGQPSLSSAEKTVYSLIDGRRNIEEIIHVSLLGEFYACQAFLSLMERGWIRVAAPAPPEPERRLTPLAGKEMERATLIRGAFAVAVALVLLLTIQLVTLGPEQKRFSIIPVVRQEAPVCRLLNHAQRDLVLHALEVYRKEKGRYPERLAHLVQERLLRPGDLSLWGSNHFSYVVGPEGEFRLLIAPLPN